MKTIRKIMTQSQLNKIKSCMLCYIAFVTTAAEFMYIRFNYYQIFAESKEAIFIFSISVLISFISVGHFGFTSHARYNTIIQLSIVLWITSTIYFFLVIALPSI